MASIQPLHESNVQSWEKGNDIKQVHRNGEIHLDHIPSQQAIKEAYAISDFIISKEKECQIKN